MRLNFTTLSDPIQKEVGQVATGGTPSIHARSARPTLPIDAGDTVGQAPGPLLKKEGEGWHLSHLSHLEQNEVGRGTPSIHAVVPLVPLVPLFSESSATAASFDREAFDERAAILEFDGGMSRADAEALALTGGVPVSDPDRNCWPHSSTMNTAEIDAFNERLHLFTRRGLDYSEAERLADRLVIRDRDGDERRMCLECAGLDARGRCLPARRGAIPGAGRVLEPVTTILQRCEGFTS